MKDFSVKEKTGQEAGKISIKIKNIAMEFQTDDTLFSPHAIDKGTYAMLSAIEFTPEDKVLDLGCGYGVVGILAAKIIGQEKVTMCDISPVAVKCAKENAARNQVPRISIIESNGFQQIRDNNFTLILSNPPYHVDFSVPKQFIEGSFRRLTIGGRLVMVTKRLTWYRKKITAVFGGVKIVEKDGYYIFIAEKRADNVKFKEKRGNRLSKKLQKKYRNKMLAREGKEVV